MRAGGYTGGLHFHGHCAGGVQLFFLPGGLRHVVYGTYCPRVVGRRAGYGQDGVAAVPGGDAGAHHHSGNIQARVQRAAESGADHGFGVERWYGGIHGVGGARASGPVGGHQNHMASQPGGAGPVHGQPRGFHAAGVLQNTRKLHAIGCHQ